MNLKHTSRSGHPPHHNNISTSLEKVETQTCSSGGGGDAMVIVNRGKLLTKIYYDCSRHYFLFIQLPFYFFLFFFLSSYMPSFVLRARKSISIKNLLVSYPTCLRIETSIFHHHDFAILFVVFLCHSFAIIHVMFIDSITLPILLQLVVSGQILRGLIISKKKTADAIYYDFIIKPQCRMQTYCT